MFKRTEIGCEKRRAALRGFFTKGHKTRCPVTTEKCLKRIQKRRNSKSELKWDYEESLVLIVVALNGLVAVGREKRFAMAFLMTILWKLPR